MLREQKKKKIVDYSSFFSTRFLDKLSSKEAKTQVFVLKKKRQIRLERQGQMLHTFRVFVYSEGE